MRAVWSNFCLLLAAVVTTGNAAPSAEAIYRELAPAGAAVELSPTSAKYQQGGVGWSMFGAVQQLDESGALNRGGEACEHGRARLLANQSAFNTNVEALPGCRVDGDQADSGGLVVTLTPGEHEPGSFFVLAGNARLASISVTATDLRSDAGDILPSDAIDLRLVKWWYQAASRMRTAGGARKTFVPELLLHDPSLVRTNDKYGVNIVRSGPSIRDAETLQSFSVEAGDSQQIWLTIHAADGLRAGSYRGEVHVTGIRDGAELALALPLQVTILPFSLEPATAINGMFYLGRPVNRRRPGYEARGKTPAQFSADVRDMLSHGVNLISLDHDFAADQAKPGLPMLKNALQLARAAGVPANRTLYIDWKMTGVDSAQQYRQKIQQVAAVAEQAGPTELWVYNLDERSAAELLRNRHTFEAARQVGAKNITAMVKVERLDELATVMDVLVIKHDTPRELVRAIQSKGMLALAYGVPHAGEENPAQTRAVYGYARLLGGFDGVMSYAYQAGNCWDDWFRWGANNFRPNVMAYPTDDAPIPTLQWEAWREALDDLRYYDAYRRHLESGGKAAGEPPPWLDPAGAGGPQGVRTRLISEILQRADTTIAPR